MRMYSCFSLLFVLHFCIPTVAFSQIQKTITGHVFHLLPGNKKEDVAGATLFLPAENLVTTADTSGKFVEHITEIDSILVITFTGFLTDTIYLKNYRPNQEICLQPIKELDEIAITETRKTTEIGLMGTIKTEIIGQQELYKAACCNLGESFETIPSVDVAFTDAVTGYRQVKLLGLSGPYSLITQENIPEVRGLVSTTGLTYTPGAWIESMQLSKGTGSVVNGFEGISGQINVELKKPEQGEQIFLNLYQSSQGKSQADAVYRYRINKRWSTMLMLDLNTQWLKTDLNYDNYLDLPLSKQINVMNRWLYQGDHGWMVQAGVRFLIDNGLGGQWNYKAGDAQEPGSPWGFTTTTQRFEDWAKIAKVFQQRAGTSIGLQLYNVSNTMDAQFGPNGYFGAQTTYYANLIFQTYIGNTNNIIKTGSSNILDINNERAISQTFNRFQNVAGVFAEFTHNFSDKLSAVAGLRGDHDNIYGNYATPRLHIRYAPFKRTTLRFSTGRAQKTANIFADNIGYFASNRQVDILNPVAGKPYGLNPEVAWTTGANLVQKFRINNRDAILSADYYYTNFQSQVVVDIENPEFLNYYNLQGRSYANSFSVQWDYELIRKLNLRLAYRYNKIMCTYDGVLEEKPFTPTDRAFANLSYITRNKWKFDYTVQWTGEERTPGVTHHHGGHSLVNGPNSPTYFQMNTEITKVFSKKLEVYAGIDNITDYMQHDAIIDPSHPYARDFDASLIWGPMMGFNAFAGLRYKAN